jgi:hypothetical protein
VGDHVGILGAVVFAFCFLDKARVVKDPLRTCDAGRRSIIATYVMQAIEMLEMLF